MINSKILLGIACALSLSLASTVSIASVGHGSSAGHSDNGSSSGSSGNSGTRGGFNDNGMGRDTRSESSIGYLRTTYGPNTDNWPCESISDDIGVPASQVNTGDAPAGHSSHRSGKHMRDRK